MVSSSSSSSVACPASAACRAATCGQSTMSPSRPSVGLLAVAAGAQLVHREAHDVGGPGQVHPLDVQLLHGRLVHELEAQVGAAGGRASASST